MPHMRSFEEKASGQDAEDPAPTAPVQAKNDFLTIGQSQVEHETTQARAVQFLQDS